MDESKLIEFLETFQIAEIEDISYIDKIGKEKMYVYNIQFKKYPGKVFVVNSKFWYNLYKKEMYVYSEIDNESMLDHNFKLKLTLPQTYRIRKHVKEMFTEQEQRKVRKAVKDFYDSISKSE